MTKTTEEYIYIRILVCSPELTKIKTIKSAYWGKNSNADEGLRGPLGLK